MKHRGVQMLNGAKACHDVGFKASKLKLKSQASWYVTGMITQGLCPINTFSSGIAYMCVGRF